MFLSRPKKAQYLLQRSTFSPYFVPCLIHFHLPDLWYCPRILPSYYPAYSIACFIAYFYHPFPFTPSCCLAHYYPVCPCLFSSVCCPSSMSLRIAFPINVCYWSSYWFFCWNFLLVPCLCINLH